MCWKGAESGGEGEREREEHLPTAVLKLASGIWFLVLQSMWTVSFCQFLFFFFANARHGRSGSQYEI